MREMRSTVDLCSELVVLSVFGAGYAVLAVWAWSVAEGYRGQQKGAADFAYALVLCTFLLLKFSLCLFLICKSVLRHTGRQLRAAELKWLRTAAVAECLLALSSLAAGVALIVRLFAWTERFQSAGQRSNVICCIWCLSMLFVDVTLQCLLVALLLCALRGGELMRAQIQRALFIVVD